MKRIALLALIATLALSGCSLWAPKSAAPTKAPVPALSIAWEKSQPVKSSVIDNALFDNNVCQSEPSLNDGVYVNDALTMYRADTYRQCSTFHDYTTDGAKMACPINAYIVTGKGAGTDVKHALSYEDGWSLAILYGKGWEISLDPASDMSNGETEQDIIKKCASTLASYNKLIGGGIVHYGDYKN
jgi:hypothetical protein